MSKGYTISFFVNVLSSTTARNLNSTTAVFSAVSPRLGSRAVKARALNNWLGGHTTAIVNGTGRFATFGRSPRARLLTALRLRKRNGSV